MLDIFSWHLANASGEAEFITTYTSVNAARRTSFEALFDTIDVRRDGFLYPSDITRHQAFQDPRTFSDLGVQRLSDTVLRMATDAQGRIDRERFVDHMTNASG